jgi:hypothetical protein
MTTVMTLFSTFMLAFWPKVSSAQSNAPLNAANLGTYVIRRSPHPQPTIPSDATNWGNSVLGVQLLIYATNRAADTGSSITVLTVIKNGSSNSIQLAEQGKSRDFNLLLANATGKLYHLTPLDRHSISGLELDAKELGPFDIPVTFPRNIESGDYLLTAERPFFVRSATYMLQSNPLKIHIEGATGGAVPQR